MRDYEKIYRTIEYVIGQHNENGNDVASVIARRRERLRENPETIRYDVREPLMLVREDMGRLTWWRINLWKSPEDFELFRQVPVGILYDDGKWLDILDMKTYKRLYNTFSNYESSYPQDAIIEDTMSNADYIVETVTNKQTDMSTTTNNELILVRYWYNKNKITFKDFYVESQADAMNLVSKLPDKGEVEIYNITSDIVPDKMIYKVVIEVSDNGILSTSVYLAGDDEKKDIGGVIMKWLKPVLIYNFIIKAVNPEEAIQIAERKFRRLSFEKTSDGAFYMNEENFQR